MTAAQVARIVARWIGAFPYPAVTNEMMKEIGDSIKKYEYADADIGVTNVRDSYTNSIRPAIAVLRNAIIDAEVARIRADNNKKIEDERLPTKELSDEERIKLLTELREAQKRLGA